MAGCANPTSDAGNPSIEAKADDALISKLDHPMGAGHCWAPLLLRETDLLRQLGDENRFSR